MEIEKRRPVPAPSLLDKIKTNYNEYLAPVVDAQMDRLAKLNEQEKQQMDDSYATMKDKIVMRNPDVQGPPQVDQDNLLGLTQDDNEKYMNLATGSITSGSSGKALKQTLENLANTGKSRSYSVEKSKALEQLAQQIMQSPTISNEKKAQVLSKFNEYLRQAAIRGIK